MAMLGDSLITGIVDVIIHTMYSKIVLKRDLRECVVTNPKTREEFPDNIK